MKTKRPNIKVLYEPTRYFDAKLAYYAVEGGSLLFAKEMQQQMKRLSPDAFLQWLEEIRFLPLYNPQTFQLNAQKDLSAAKERLRQYDYVVPYEMLERFAQETGYVIKAEELHCAKMPFGMAEVKEKALAEKFIGKDMLLYQEALLLWQHTEAHGFKPLSKTLDAEESPDAWVDISGYTGMIDLFTPDKVAGWIVHASSDVPIEVGIYRNGELLERIVTDKMRSGIKQRFDHSTGLCGFQVNFGERLFAPGDTLEVRTMKGNYVLEYAPAVKQVFAWLQEISK